MGTNFYVEVPPSCGGKCATHCRATELHLGKSSMGWTFTFRAYPDPPTVDVDWAVKDFASWRRLIDLGQIRDEYHAPVAVGELLELVENKRGGINTLYGHDFLDGDGNRFVAGDFC